MNSNSSSLTAGAASLLLSLVAGCADLIDGPSTGITHAGGPGEDMAASGDVGTGTVVADAFNQPPPLPADRKGPPPVGLGTAVGFVVLAKAGVSTVPTSSVTGDLGVSPIDSTAFTGFSLTLDGSGTFSLSRQVVGRLYAAAYAAPTPARLTAAIGDMEAAYTEAAGRPNPDFTELAGGDLSGLTLAPGLYKWGTGVLISSDVTLNGGPHDVWIFQIAGGLTETSGVRVHLAGGALPKNIFWQTFGAVTFQTTAHMEGIVLSKTTITAATGATVNGRLLSQTAVTLDAATITQPAL